MKKTLVPLSCLLLLACGGAPTVDQLAKDPELLAKVTLQCAELGLKGEDTNIAKCNNAQKAMKQKMDETTELLERIGKELGN